MELLPGPSLRTLLARRDLRLTLLSDESEAVQSALDRPMRWVHSSDLSDPTPFLADDLVLLTTGTQLSEGEEAVSAYVERLSRRDVIALGFGSGVHRRDVPEGLVQACAAHGMPLFEVPYDVPFIAIARGHAEAIAAQAYARRTWALDAQRALALAALRPRGLEAALTELARRLESWVGLFDAAGGLVHEHPARGGAGGDAVASAVRGLLQRGSSASRTAEDAGQLHTLFTLGRTGHLRGVVAIATAAHDPETRAVITSVIAMAGLALEQNERISRARRRLHDQLLESLMAGDPALARRVLGSLPRTPVLVAVTDASRAGSVIDWWERARADAGAAPFIAEGDGVLTICVSESQRSSLDELAAQFDLAVGVSAPADYSRFSQAHAQAMAAMRRSADGAVTGYSAAGDVFDAMVGDEARLLARSRLAPLRHHDESTGAELERTLVTWLENDTHSERTAEALGIHRHTLRTRIAQSATLLQADLSSFPVRAELWAALRMAG